MTYNRTARALACALLALLFMPAGRAAAVDGVIEINQARATAGGVTPGDMPGFPITINTGGTFANESMSFRLTGPLFNSTTANIIEVTTPHVTIDLNGFAISCLLPQCMATAILSNEANVTVMNGTIRSYLNGVSLNGSGSRVENVRALENVTGLNVGPNCLVRNNTASGNSGPGIVAQAGCTLIGNTINNNGGDGVDTNGACNLIGNTAIGNGLFQLNLSSGTGYSQNVISGTNTVTGGATAAGSNVCNGSLTCP